MACLHCRRPNRVMVLKSFGLLMVLHILVAYGNLPSWRMPNMLRENGEVISDYAKIRPTEEPSTVLESSQEYGFKSTTNLVNVSQIARKGAKDVHGSLNTTGLSTLSLNGPGWVYWKSEEYERAGRVKVFPTIKDQGGETLYLISASYDARKHVIAVIVDIKMKASVPIWFEMRLPSPAEPWDTKCTKFDSIASRIRQHRVIHCPLPPNISKEAIPSTIIIRGSEQKNSKGVELPVYVSKVPRGGMLPFAVCIPPLERNFSKVNELIEFIEINRIFGASHFTFYDHQSSPDLRPVFESYAKEGIVDVINWPLYPNAVNLVVYYGQIASMYDCLFRNLHRAVYVAFLDVDEMLVPRRNGWTTWGDIVAGKNADSLIPQLLREREFPPTDTHHNVEERLTLLSLQALERAKKAKITGWSLRCAFFKKEWPSVGRWVNNSVVQDIHVNSLLKTMREKLIWPHEKRTKYILMPWTAAKLDVHIPRVTGGTSSISKELPVDSLLYHFRNWEDSNITAARINAMGVVDDFLERDYGDRILNGIVKRYQLAGVPIPKPSHS